MNNEREKTIKKSLKPVKVNWSDEEVKTLINLASYMTPSEIAVKLNRTVNSIRIKMRRLGIPSVSSWSEEEVRTLINLASYMTPSEIAVKLNRTVNSIRIKMGKLSISSVRSWTKEEENYLMDYWGFVQTEAIANALNRSVRAVNHKAAELNMLSAKNEAAFLKIKDISTITGLSIYKIRSFEKLGLQIKTNSTSRKSEFYYIDFEDFINFLEKNQHLYSAAAFEMPYFIGAPEWLWEKKKRDSLNAKPKRKHWTTQEKSLAKQMYLNGLDFYQIAKRLGRTDKSIKHICYQK